jgi:serine/threonine protein kinase
MPPEIVYGKKHSREVDIWALGVLLYELIHGKLVLTAGRAPYSAETIEEVQEKMKITEYVFKKTLSKEAKGSSTQNTKARP